MPMQFMVNQMAVAAPRQTAISLEDAIEMFQAGTPWAEIEALAGFGRAHLRQQMIAAGTWKPRAKAIPERTVLRAIALRSRGVTWREVAEQVGWSYSGIKGVVQARGQS